MRIILNTCKNTEPIDFNYQQKLVGCVHKWLGEYNEEHGNISLYSFSWLKGGQKKGNHLSFENGAQWFISFYDSTCIKTIVSSILKSPTMFGGMVVTDICVQEEPDFSTQTYFKLASPILIKRKDENTGREKHYIYDEDECSELLLETIKRKMEMADLPEDKTLKIKFDSSYIKKTTKLIRYRNISSRANLCPVIIEGKDSTKAFIWNVGLGNSTGIGLGSIQ